MGRFNGSNDSNLIHFHGPHDEDEWDCDHSCECDGDCENCDHPPVPMEDDGLDLSEYLIHTLVKMRFERLARDAYDVGVMTKEQYIDILGHGLAEFEPPKEDEDE